jgi:ribosomal protein S18 acetylase RimI-like enzyme
MPDEAPHLTELVLRSKASWGYDDTFLEGVGKELMITAEDIDNGSVFVLEVDGVVVGLYALSSEPPDGLLTDLWLEPEVQGRGLGRRLWEHALTSAAALGHRSLMLEADPNAEGFYAAMGAIRIGERESPVAQDIEPGRTLPLMRIELASS